MKRRKFIQKGAMATGALGLAVQQSLAANGASSYADNKEIYELRRYSLKFGRNANPLKDYLKDALIPALNRHSASKVGVFSEYSQNNPVNWYVLIVYDSWASYGSISGNLAEDKKYQKASADYHALSPDQAPYSRISSSLMDAFDGLPQMRPTDTGKDRIFELRIYESYSEDAHRRKVHMFDNGEIDIFDEVGLPSVFYGRNLAGENIPCLTYMLVFDGLEHREAAWKRFFESPKWNEIKVKPEYANTVSNIHRLFLLPTEYSQI
jgi:hypothetical protein